MVLMRIKYQYLDFVYCVSWRPDVGNFGVRGAGRGRARNFEERFTSENIRKKQKDFGIYGGDYNIKTPNSFKFDLFLSVR